MAGVASALACLQRLAAANLPSSRNDICQRLSSNINHQNHAWEITTHREICSSCSAVFNRGEFFVCVIIGSGLSNSNRALLTADASSPTTRMSIKTCA